MLNPFVTRELLSGENAQNVSKIIIRLPAFGSEPLKLDSDELEVEQVQTYKIMHTNRVEKVLFSIKVDDAAH